MSHSIYLFIFVFTLVGFPAVVVTVTLAITRVRGYGRGLSKARTCWLAVDNGLIWVFVTPALIVILVNNDLFS